MNKKDNIKNIFIAVIFIITISLSTNVFAEDDFQNLQTITNNTKTETYKKWEELPEQEKNNYIQPLPFSVEANTTTDTTSTTNNFSFALKASSSIPTKYSLADNINIKVRDQRQTYECWAFSTTSIISMNMEKLGLKSGFILLSPRHMDYTTSAYSLSDLAINPKGYERTLSKGANAYIGLSYCSAGYGPVLETDMPFENNRTKVLSSAINGKQIATKVENYTVFPGISKTYSTTNNKLTSYTNGLTGENKVIYKNVEASDPQNTQTQATTEVENIRKSVKEHIMNYGGISSYTYASTNEYFNTNQTAYYCDNADAVPDHGVTIVGWDDNYDVSNFNSNHRPQTNGAYLVLNSWGESFGNAGYYYISYEDSLIEQSLVGVIKTADKDYDKIYQYDEFGYNIGLPANSGINSVYMSNVFSKTSTGTTKEYLTQVGVYIPIESDADIYVNTSSDSKTETSKVATVTGLKIGYNTIKLDNPLEITGDKFVVSAKLYNSTTGSLSVPLELNYKSNKFGNNFWDKAKSNAGESYISIDGISWQDITEKYTDTNVCLKAFTTIKQESNDTKNEDNNTANQENKQIIANGTYEINAKINSDKTLDIAGGSTDNGANVQIYQGNWTGAQKFNITYLGDGYYKIENVKSSKVLDVAGGRSDNGTNVQQYESNDTDAQKWKIQDNQDGTYSLIAKCSNLYLDIAGGKSEDGTNVQTYEGNGTNAQKFIFYNTQTIQDGTYEINTNLDSNKTLDIEWGSTDNGANVQIYEKNGTGAQKFNITYLGNGYYKIENAKSNKVLDVAGAGIYNGTNVQQYESNNTDAQKWEIRDNQDGTYSVISKCNYLSLDIAGGRSDNGTNVQVYELNGTNAQKYIFN